MLVKGCGTGQRTGVLSGAAQEQTVPLHQSGADWIFLLTAAEAPVSNASLTSVQRQLWFLQTRKTLKTYRSETRRVHMLRMIFVLVSEDNRRKPADL